jgi:hypothetical protein
MGCLLCFYRNNSRLPFLGCECQIGGKKGGNQKSKVKGQKHEQNIKDEGRGKQYSSPLMGFVSKV